MQFIDSRLGWRWYAILAVVVATTFGAGCWIEFNTLSRFVDSHISVHIPADYTISSLAGHWESMLSAWVMLAAAAVLFIVDQFRPCGGYHACDWMLSTEHRRQTM